MRYSLLIFRKKNNNNRYLLATAILLFVYIIVFSLLSILKYQAFNNDLDIGNMLQAFYSTLHGRFMEMTWNGAEYNACMWRGHAEIVFLLIFPIFALFPHAFTLLILQTIAIAGGGIAVYLIARAGCSDRTVPVVLAVCYWLYPLLASINLVDFHADAFMIAPHLFAWYFLRTGRIRLFWLAIAAGIMVKEHAFIFNALLGAMILLTHRKYGMMLLLLAFAQFFMMTPLIQYLAGFSTYHINLAQHAIGDPNSTPVQALSAYAGHFAHNLFSARAGFVLMIIFTLNITLILFPRGLILIIPLAMIFVATGSVTSHRHAILIAPLFITLVEGVARIKDNRQFRYVVGGVFIPTILALMLSPDSLLGTNFRELIRPDYRNVFHYRYTRHDAIADSLIRLIPPGVPVAADASLRTKLVDRQYVFINPSPIDSMRADYHFFDFFERREYDDAWPARRRAAALLQSGNFSLVSNVDGLVIIKKCGSIDGTDDFRVQPIDTCAVSPSEEYIIGETEIETAGTWYTMRLRFDKGMTNTTLKQAFISLFIDSSGHDTIRVLHLASYTACRMEHLNAGRYVETFRFNVPLGKSISNRRHELWLYVKEGYLPFFARPEYRRRLCLKDDQIRLK